MRKVKLGDIATVITKGTTPTTLGYDFVDEGINFIKIENITEDGEFISEKFTHITSDCNNKLSRSQLQRNDLLFSIAGAIGRTAIVTEKILPANTNQALAIIRIPEGVVDYCYLKYVLQSPGVLKQLEKRKQGVAQLNISLKDVGEFEIPIYSIEEQRVIVTLLEKVSKLIALRKQQLSKLDELVKSRFVEMFGDPTINPMGWTADNMKAICTKITDGEHGSVVRVESGNVFLNAKHIKKDGTIDWGTVTYTTNEVHNKIYARCNPEPGDILLTTTGTIGNVAIVPDVPPFSMDRGITLLKLNGDKAKNKFVAALLNFERIQEVMNSNVHASAIGHLFLNKVMQIPVIVPPIELQNKFVVFVEQTDKSKLAVQKSLEKLETLKKSLVQEYFG